MDAQAKKAHKSGGPEAAQRMANGARMRVLERRLGIKMKTNRDPGRPPKSTSHPFKDREADKDESIIIKVD